MYQRIAHITLVVEDYDDAIEFYTQKNVVCYLPKQLMKGSQKVLEIKPADELGFFSLRMIFGEIIIK